MNQTTFLASTKRAIYRQFGGPKTWFRISLRAEPEKPGEIGDRRFNVFVNGGDLDVHFHLSTGGLAACVSRQISEGKFHVSPWITDPTVFGQAVATAIAEQMTVRDLNIRGVNLRAISFGIFRKG